MIGILGGRDVAKSLKPNGSSFAAMVSVVLDFNSLPVALN